ncbi:ABC transporter substrate-binding protein [Microbacterium sp. Marseille-Q6648]|uniref:ABC transporter substrate-binding protein n=1 Tax=Microbacterium sp. Marseille-Q6648 TaxID=2937991 RepID=UPI00203F2CA1|nr:ABC transporter substrate-binding protein [Microbacterium sp. Marseille-Q6648]
MKSATRKTAIPLAVFALVLTGCTQGDTDTPTESSAPEASGTLRVNFGAFPETWAPGYEFEGGPMRIVYENLITRDDAGELAPGLAESWELNDDSTSLTLTLRQGVSFHDGEPFNAEAVAQNIDTVKNTPGPFGAQLAPIDSVDAPDEHTVIINFSAPTPSMPNTLSTRVLPIASPAAIEDGSVATNPVGTAPWAYDEAASTAGTVMSFTLYEDYWGDAPAFENIELYAIPDDEAAAAAVVNGEIDITDTEEEVLPRFDGTTVESFEYPAIRNNVMFFDRGAGGLFEDVEVRQAVCYAINVQQMVDVSGGEAATQHFLEGTLGHNPDIAGYPTDVEQARSLWQSAGSPQIAGEMIAAPFTTTQSTIYMDQASQLDGFGIEVTTVPPPEWFQGWNSGSYPIGIGSNDEQTPFEWYKAWFAADAGGNPSGTESDELKTAADAAIAAGDSEEAEGLWAEVTKIIADEALTCAHARGFEIIAFNADTVQGVEESNFPFEANNINLREITPAG